MKNKIFVGVGVLFLFIGFFFFGLAAYGYSIYKVYGHEYFQRYEDLTKISQITIYNTKIQNQKFYMDSIDTFNVAGGISVGIGMVCCIISKWRNRE